MVSKTASQSVGSGGFVKTTNPNNSKIKQIVETTRCTRAEAEEALREVGGELESACSWILDHGGDNVWNVKKSRKVANNKKSESGAAPAAAEVKAENKKAGSGAAPAAAEVKAENKKAEPGAAPAAAEVKPETKKAERRGGGPFRGGSRGAGNNRPAWKGGQSRGAGNNRPAWKGGQSWTRTEHKPASPPVTTETTQSPPVAPTPVQPEVIKTAAGPMSFAAVCAAGVKKQEPPTSTTQVSSGAVSSGPKEIVTTPEVNADDSTMPEANAELEAATPEVHADDEAMPEASAELEAANPEIQTEIEAHEETVDEPKVSTPDHLEQIGQNAWAEKFYMEKAAPPVIEMRKPILELSETVVILSLDKPVMKTTAVPTFTPPVSTPSTPAVFNSNPMPAGFPHSSYYHHPPQTQQVQQQQQQPVLSQSQQQQMYNPLHYGSYVPPPPGLSGPTSHLYHNQQYQNMHYYAMQMGHQMYPAGNAANTSQVQNRRYDTNQHSGVGHNTMPQHHYAQWNS